MGGEIEAQHLELAVQLFRGKPRRVSGKRDPFRSGCRPCTEDIALSAHLVFLRALGKAEDAIETADKLGTVVTEAIEGAGGDQAFEHAPVEQLRVDPQAEVLKVGELAVTTNGNDVLDRRFTDALDGCQ
ncbi:hypothetical protein D3C87_1764980 [compost metagenome]